jgi:hypothetical protein
VREREKERERERKREKERERERKREIEEISGKHNFTDLLIDWDPLSIWRNKINNKNIERKIDILMFYTNGFLFQPHQPANGPLPLM